jgi:hypothetical protein
MFDKQDGALLLRIIGIVVSTASAIILLLKPLEIVTNTLLGYFLLILSAILVMTGQLITIRINAPGDFSSQAKRHEALYDAISIGVVMVLFVFFYAIPYVSKYTTWL